MAKSKENWKSAMLKELRDDMFVIWQFIGVYTDGRFGGGSQDETKHKYKFSNRGSMRMILMLYVLDCDFHYRSPGMHLVPTKKQIL